MSSRLIKTIAALGASGAVALTGASGASAAASTKVTIQGGGSISGFVKSSNENKCANGRKVKLFKQKGGEQGGGDDIKIGSDTASPNGDKFQYAFGNPGNGKFYAKAGRIPGCEPDTSKTVQN